MQNIGNFYVYSKAGTWTVHRQTGLIATPPGHNSSPAFIPEMSNITPLMFDIDRWKKTYWEEQYWDQPMELGVTINIMAIGLWYRDCQGNIQYEGPAHDARGN